MTGPDLRDLGRHDHGTRARYVAGCRCADCTRANVERYHARQARRDELAAEVTPNGPPTEGTMMRGGRLCRIRRCPGGNGIPCVKGGAWLKMTPVCKACIERHTVWDGIVSPARARAHVARLRRAGVGKRAISEASDVALSVIDHLMKRDRPIRASTERALLAVDAGARADGGLVPAAKSRKLLEAMRDEGEFTGRHLARLLGQHGPTWQIGARFVTAKMAARVARLHRRWKAGELVPDRVVVTAPKDAAWLGALLRYGVPARHLAELVGFHVSSPPRKRMRRENLEALRRARAEIEERYGRGDGGCASYATEYQWLEQRERRLRKVGR